MKPRGCLKPRMSSRLWPLLAFACLMHLEPVFTQEIFLSEDLNLTEFNDVIFTCSYPEIANNDTCTCAPGFTWRNNLCTSCEPGKYKTDDGLHECTSCPVYHFTFENATESADCLCTYGYEPDNAAQSCSACQPGFYKEFIGSNFCLACTANASTLTQNGVTITGSTSESDCKCLPGFQGTFDTGCTACAVHYFKASSTPDQACTACIHLGPHLGTSGPAGDDASDCMCKPGFYLESTSGICTPCAPATYKPELGNLVACSACPPNSTSTSASQNIEACICETGFFRDSGVASVSCAVCTAGFFCEGQGLKQQCPEHSHSSAGSTSEDQCMCSSSRYKVAGMCFDCPPDFFCPGDNTKHACPDNSEAHANSTSLADCVCDGGFQKQTYA